MFLGFISLLFVPSTPMKNLGIAGAMGAGMAFTSAYLIYPWFLERASAARPLPWTSALKSGLRSFFSERHGFLVAGLLVFTLIGAYGLLRLNTDPDLPSYFKKGGEIRTNLDFVDKLGGSSPLKLVVEEKKGAQLNDNDEYYHLWRLQEWLEKDPALGCARSVQLYRARLRSPIRIRSG